MFFLRAPPNSSFAIDRFGRDVTGRDHKRVLPKHLVAILSLPTSDSVGENRFAGLSPPPVGHISVLRQCQPGAVETIATWYGQLLTVKGSSISFFLSQPITNSSDEMRSLQKGYVESFQPSIIKKAKCVVQLPAIFFLR